MSEPATETVVTETTHVEPPATSTDVHLAEQVGSLVARVEQLANDVAELRTAQTSTEQEVERVEEQAEQATETAVTAHVEAIEAEQAAEMATEVAVVAAEIAVEAEDTAEEVEEVVTDGGTDGEPVTTVEDEAEAPSEESASRRRRRGVYGRR
jgi:methyl-accepting chemotaxis protein